MAGTNGTANDHIFLQRLIANLKEDINDFDIQLMKGDFKDWAAERRIAIWEEFSRWAGGEGSPLLAEEESPARYLAGLQRIVGTDINVIRAPSLRAELLMVQANPVLKLQFDRFLRAERLAQPGEFWEAVQDGTGSAARSPLMCAQDFLLEDDEDIDWVMDGLIATGTLSLLAGPPKAGKSTFVRHLLVSILAGTPFLGRETQKGKVLLYSLEDPHKVSGRHFAELGLLPTMPLWGRQTHEGGPFLDTLRQDVSEVEPDLIVVDTMNVALDWDDMNNMVETTQKMTPLRELARSTNAAIILLAHTRKTSTGSALDILGSTGLRAASDVNMVLHHDEETDVRSLKTEGKLGEHFKHTPIALDAGRCTLGKHSQLNPIVSAMLEVLIVEPGHTLSHNQWLRACKVGTREKRVEAITRLQHEGLVTSERGEKNAMYYTVFSPDMG